MATCKQLNFLCAMFSLACICFVYSLMEFVIFYFAALLLWFLGIHFERFLSPFVLFWCFFHVSLPNFHGLFHSDFHILSILSFVVITLSPSDVSKHIYLLNVLSIDHYWVSFHRVEITFVSLIYILRWVCLGCQQFFWWTKDKDKIVNKE